jgi:hypothetical protein
MCSVCSAYMLVYVRKNDLPDVMRSLRTSAVTSTTAGPAAAARSAAAATSAAAGSGTVTAAAAGADSTAATDDSSTKAAAAATAAAAPAGYVDEDYTGGDMLGADYESGEAVDPMELDDHDLGFRVLGDKADSSSDLSAAAAADVAEIDLEGIPPELRKRFREGEEAILQAAQDERVSTAQPLLHLAV